MKTKALRKSARDSYMDLIKQFPLRPIRTRSEYAVASRILDGLAVRGESKLDRGEADYLDVLSDLIEAYDEKHAARIDPGTPSARLVAVMESSGTTPEALSTILGVTRALVSMMLSGKRSLSIANVRKLASHFHLDPGYFV